MSYLNWHVGMKVVCVKPFGDELMKGNVYTITWLGGGSVFRHVPHCRVNGGEQAWMLERFRPVHDRKTDISIFTRMLNPQKQEERA
jgi:hypothetical protein